MNWGKINKNVNYSTVGRLFIKNNYEHLLFILLLFFLFYKLGGYKDKFISMIPDQWTVIIGLSDSVYQNHIGNTLIIIRLIASIIDGFASPFYIWYIFNLLVWALVLIALYTNILIAFSSRMASIVVIALFTSSPRLYGQFALPYSQACWSLPLLIVLIYAIFVQKRRCKVFGFFHVLVSISCYLVFSSSIIFVNLFILSLFIYLDGFSNFARKVSLKAMAVFLAINSLILLIQEKISSNYPSVDPGANIMFFGGNYFENVDINSELILSFVRAYVNTQIFWLHAVFFIALFIFPLYLIIFIFGMNLSKKIDFFILFLLFNFYLMSIFIVRYNGVGILNYDRYFMYIFILLLIPFGVILKNSFLAQKVTALVFIIVVIFRLMSFDSNLDYQLGNSQLSNRETKTLYIADDSDRSWAIKIVQVCLEGDRSKFEELAVLGHSNKLNFSTTCQRVNHWFEG